MTASGARRELLSLSRERRSAALSRAWRALKFGLVGASGMVVNTLALVFATEALGIHYLLSVIAATQASTVWNYVLIDALVFDRQRTTHSKARRFASYWALNMAAMVARYPIVWLLTSGIGIHYAISNLISLVILFLVRFTVSDRWIWASSGSHRVGAETEPAGEEPLTEHR